MMDPTSSLAALMAFAGLTFLHVAIEVICRQFMFISGKIKPTEFGKSRNASEDTFQGRVSNSHLNCLENLQLATVVILINHLAEGAPDISKQCWYYVAARTGQALSHCASVGLVGVTSRFLFFFDVQGPSHFHGL
mmetsp:Transcript_28120/g.43291  ORF Transcript_28120/g.43291 Transcript_28120/m.43291 type:complete len:135 (-) Transcript_28120:264-668(-)